MSDTWASAYDWQDRYHEVLEENDKLREALKKLRQSHYECEDCWYSCPKSGECCNDNKKDECNCGADRMNAIIDEALGVKDNESS